MRLPRPRVPGPRTLPAGVARAALVALLLGACLGLATEPAAPPATAPRAEDPFPIRRLVLAADALAAELDKAKPGAFVRLPRADFEALARQAAQANKPDVPGPRLVAAHYRARLQDTPDEPALVGTAEWKLTHPGQRPALLNLEPLQIALRQARWLDGRAAAIGLIDPRNPAALALLVEEAGEQSLALEWSARGLPGPGEISFALAIPAAAVASLEIDVPAGLTPVPAQGEASVYGPFPVDDKRHSWQITCGGLARLELSLRKEADTGRPAPLPRTRLTSRQDLGPGVARCRFNLDLEVLRGPLTELALDHDPELTVTDVSVNNLESWKPQLSPVAGKKRLLVRFREPTSGGRVEISGTAPVSTGEARLWTSPGIAAVNGVSRGETLELRLAPDLQLADWRPGGFRLARSETAPDGTQTLSLHSTVAADSGGLARPWAVLRAPGSEFRVRQHTDWFVRPERSTLTSVLDVAVTRGALGQLGLRLPEGDWAVESVDTVPRDLTPQTLLPSGKSGTLGLEFPRPLTPETPCAVTVRLQRPGPRLAAEERQVIPLPDVIPLGARARAGTLSVHVSPAFQASAPVQPPEPDFVGPPLPPPAGPGAAWVYHFQGHPPVGSLHLRARPARLAARCEVDVASGPGGPRARARLHLRPDGGVLPSILLWSASPVTAPWNWHTVEGANPVADSQPALLGTALPLLGLVGAGTPVEAAARLGMAREVGGHWWRLTFTRPLDGPVILESTYEPSPTERYPVPLPVVVGAERMEGLVSLHLPAGSGRGWQATGLVPDRRDPAAPARHRFRYGDGPVSLVLVPHGASAGPTPAVDGGTLTTAVDRTGPWRCHFRFRIDGWTSGVLPVRLPAKAELLEAAVAGRMLSSVRTTAEAGTATCSLPLPSGPGWQEVELLYTLPAEPWAFSTRAQSPAPELPVPLVALDRFWRLGPGIVPLTRDDLWPLPGTAPADGLIGLPNGTRHLLSTAIRGDWGDDADTPGQAAARTAPVRADGTTTFARALLQMPAGIDGVVLDQEALAEIGIDGETLLPAAPGPFWEPLGLVALSFRGGTILTTPRQASVWRAAALGDTMLPDSVRDASRLAAQRGHDASGRFWSAADWLVLAPTHSGILLAHLRACGLGWSGYEARDGVSGLRVLRSGPVTLTGVLFGLTFLAAVVIWGGRPRRRHWVLLAFWLLATGSAAIWLPPALRDLGRGPLLAGLLVGARLALRPGPRVADDATIVTRVQLPRLGGSASGRLVIGGLLLAAAVAGAADPEPVTVYLVPEKGTPAGAVLAAPEVVDRLKEMAAPRPTVPDAAVLRARFEGKVHNGAAEFEALFEIRSFVDGPAELVLPLGGVRLREAVLDGGAAFPQAAGPDRYRFGLSAKGEHKLVLKFAGAIAGTGADREVRFSVPEVAQAQLLFTAPDGSDTLHAVNWRGGQKVTRSPAGPGVEADLGRTRAVHVRWRQPGKPALPQVTVSELGLWDIDGPAASLLSAFDYRVSQGTVTALHLAVPAGLEVALVDVRPDPEPANAPPAWVRDWKLGPDTDGCRPLLVELQAPLGGRVRLFLELVPARPLTTRPELRFPSALDVAESAGFVGFRVQQLAVPADFNRQGVTDTGIGPFRDAWRAAGAPRIAAPSRAFRRVPGAAPVLRPALEPAGPNVRGRHELSWHVGPRRLEVRGRARWSAGGSGLALVDWDVPAMVIVTEVRGPGVHGWSRSGDRVQAWLERPQPEVELSWSGVVNRPTMTTESAVIDLPPVRLGGTATQQTLLRLLPIDGWTLTPEKADGLTPSTMPVARELVYQSEAVGASGRFVLRGPQADAAFRVLTFAEVRQQELFITARVEADLRGDRPHSLTLALREAAGFEASVLAPGCGVYAQPPQYGGRSWSVEVPPRPADRLEVVVTLSRPLPAASELTLPDLEVRQGELPSARVEHLVVAAGPELLARDWAGMRRVPDPAETATLRGWPREADRLRRVGGTLWRVAHPDWRLRLTASPGRLSGTAPVKVALADCAAAPAGGGWVYRAAFDLVHEAGANLAAQLPGGASWLGLVVDGVALPIADPDTVQLAIPLPPDAGARTVYLAWARPAPIWELVPLYTGAARLPADSVLWAVHLPAGWEVGTQPLAPPAAALYRAAALLQAARRPERDPADRASPSAGFAARAARWLALAGPQPNGTGPDGRPLAEWHALLMSQLRALRPDKAGGDGAADAASLRDEWGRLPSAEAFAHGTPVHWRPSETGDGPAFRPPSSIPVLRDLAILGLMAIVLVALGGFGLLPEHSARPERLALLGVLGAVAFGWPDGLVFLAVAVFAALTRLAAALRRLIGWVRP